MKKLTKTIAAVGVIAALGVTGYAVSSHADGGMRGGMGAGMNGRGGMMSLMEHYDTNGDGTLGVAEAKAAREAQFKKFDANGDGKLDLKEYQALWMDAMRERMVRQFQSHDSDGDGAITTAEYSKRFDRMISMMDRNNDGSINQDDRGGRGERHGMQSERGDHQGKQGEGRSCN